ncbi:uncharacterized protein LOC128215381 [Mya arenaria]|uniref:uncharacterized protein LOC128215381 n=1 Tax=Mya arenaria TaxID=6604 RepID=UPI0022DEF727|nr:uncharacterized protein LOC128215381 [Mya arenaria]
MAPDNLPNYDELSTGWSSDPALLPKLALSDIEKYLIHSSHRTSDSMKMECYRQYIRGLIFYKEKYVHKVMINTLSESSSHCYVKSKCHPSMKQGFHTQWVLMTKGTHLLIMKANCTCPAGLGEGCTHIAGLLFALAGHAADSDDTACTSKPCGWNKPRKRKNGAKTIENITFKKIGINDAEQKCNQFKIHVDDFNRQHILENAGEQFEFKSSDSGAQKQLDRIMAPKVSWIKVGVPVILLRNISTTLVNGLREKSLP